MLDAKLTSSQKRQKKNNHFNTTLPNYLDKTYNWLKIRKLNLNPSKCQVLKIQKNTTMSTFDLKISNINLSSTNVFKYLGIFIDKNLK